MYLTPKQVYEKYGYHPKTLADWADAGKIPCIKSAGGHRRYPVSALENPKSEPSIAFTKAVTYARVSTQSQKEDLQSQIDYLASRYPKCECVSDIGSGLNFKRKKFLRLMQRVADREIQILVVAHKDRLCRFGFDFVEWFCNLNNCEIVVLNNNYQSPQQEFLEDFMAIMHCFSAKLYFLRKYEKQIVVEVDKTE
jgi:predicted site-specific integrase-resolvase